MDWIRRRVLWVLGCLVSDLGEAGAVEEYTTLCELL
jgi:hypothetical protein